MKIGYWFPTRGGASAILHLSSRTNVYLQKKVKKVCDRNPAEGRGLNGICTLREYVDPPLYLLFVLKQTAVWEQTDEKINVWQMFALLPACSRILWRWIMDVLSTFRSLQGRFARLLRWLEKKQPEWCRQRDTWSLYLFPPESRYCLSRASITPPLGLRLLFNQYAHLYQY